MARKLPWTNGTTQTTLKPLPKSASAPPSARPAKRPRIEPTSPIPDKLKREIKADLTSSDLDPGTPTSSTRRGRETHKRRDGRTPSTSPPPAPPSVEFMREGFEDDDVYVMVEDEFHAMAQTFTAHLHHAEYKRLVREAREKRTANVPDLPANASFEVKAKQQRRQLEEKQNSGLNGMVTGLLASDDDKDVDDRDVAEQADRQVADPWAGTTLAGLMNWDPAASKTSLKGIERMSSGSRAAHGFASNVLDPPTNGFKTNTIARSTTLSISMDGPTNTSATHQRPIRKERQSATHADQVARENRLTARARTESLPKRSSREAENASTSRESSAHPVLVSDDQSTVREAERANRSAGVKPMKPQKKSLLDSLDGF